jgi:hypothetical protein
MLAAGAQEARVTDRVGERHLAAGGGGMWVAWLEQLTEASEVVPPVLRHLRRTAQAATIAGIQTAGADPHCADSPPPVVTT